MDAEADVDDEASRIVAASSMAVARPLLGACTFVIDRSTDLMVCIVIG